MSNVATYTWPLLDKEAICLEQDIAAPGNLALDGTLSSPGSSLNGIKFSGIQRNISISSTDDLSLVNFTVTGSTFGKPVTEVVVGVNAGTLYTDGFFDTVTSVSADAIATNVSVGTGDRGATNWFAHDIYRTFASTAVQVVAVGDIDYSFQTTLDDVTEYPAEDINSTIVAFEGIVVPSADDAEAFTKNMEGTSASQMATYTYPTRYSRIYINSSDNNGALEAKFLQQGIR